MNWRDADPTRVERAVQLLLRELHPGLRSFDGSGGDGGRDAELVTADGRTVFEVKSFSRLGSSQRRQVERSLRNAVQNVPDMNEWVLVVPANMTPRRPGARSSEESWFYGKLAALAPGVRLDWWGQDWLDARLAERSEFQRYIEGADAQVLERARLFNMESAVLARGAPDLRERLRALRERVDEVSPFWTLDFHVDGEVTETTLRPKVRDAHLLDPIRIKPTFSFDSTNPEDVKLRAQVERTLGFGGTVDLPTGRVVRLDIEASTQARKLLEGGDPTKSQFTISSERAALPKHVRCAYQVIDEQDNVIEQFPVFVRERSAGPIGATLYGSDAADIARFTIVVPRPDRLPAAEEVLTMGDADLGLELPSVVGYDIDSLLPIVKTMAAATPGTRLRFEMPGLGHITSDPLEAIQFAEAAITLDIVEGLHRVQQHTGSLYRFPSNVTNGDLRELDVALRQLNGEAVDHDGGLSLTLRADAVADFLSNLDSGEGGKPGALMYTADQVEIQVGDLAIQYGPAAFYAPAPRLTNRPDLEAAIANPPKGGGVEAKFAPTDFPFKWLPPDQALELWEGSSKRENETSP